MPGYPVPIFGPYSFGDVSCSILGPGGSFLIGGPDQATAEEGITIALTEETDTMTIGADGSVMHSLHQSRAATATVRLQKISPANSKLMQLYHFQRQSSALWGWNMITLVDVARGDEYTLAGAAFVRYPSNAYAKVGNMLEWEFNCAVSSPFLGIGLLGSAPQLA